MVDLYHSTMNSKASEQNHQEFLQVNQLAEPSLTRSLLKKLHKRQAIDAATNGLGLELDQLEGPSLIKLESLDKTSSKLDLDSIKSKAANYLDYVLKCVNLHSVRDLTAQYAIEIVLILVIVTYLIYYFTKVSSRPKLIGDPRSKFVKLVKIKMRLTLKNRFNPLIYFWGTNAQTCLFGYLQGKTSEDEMPRSKFQRQHLYISDAQYLASNVDLSQHYKLRQKENKNLAKGDCLLQLEPMNLELESGTSSGNSASSSQLNQNLRLALNGMIGIDSIQIKAATDRKSTTGIVTSHKAPASTSSSSADSGVYANSRSGSSTSRSSSASSLSEVCVNSHRQSDCNCKLLYESPLFLDHNHNGPVGGPIDKPANPTSERLQFGQCALDWHLDSHRHYHERKQVALISAGMTTGSDKKYVTDTVKNLDSLGYEVCVFIRRGVGGLKLSSARFFSPSKWRDFEAALQSVMQQRPGARLVAVGFSFGSIELCRYLSMSGERSLVDAALLVSCPFDPEAGGRNMRRKPLNRKIDAYLAKNLGKQLHWALSSAGVDNLEDSPQTLTNYNGSLVNLSVLPKIKSLVDFEDNFNRRVQNYPNSEAYAEDSRLSDHLSAIRTPTLCLSSEDDFMAPLRLLPMDEIRANPNLCMILTKRGGHMGFVDGLLWPKKPYFAQRIVESFLGSTRGEKPTTGVGCGQQLSLRSMVGVQLNASSGAV